MLNNPRMHTNNGYIQFLPCSKSTLAIVYDKYVAIIEPMKAINKNNLLIRSINQTALLGLELSKADHVGYDAVGL